MLLWTLAESQEPRPKVRHRIALSGTSQALSVDDTTGWPAETLRWLINAANASTRDDCPTSGGGLMSPSDRVFVSAHYLAWFDYTKGDGAPFPTRGWGADYSRSGALAGLWALDPETQWFRHMQLGPTRCADWARNELIPGSASIRNDAEHWWDKFAPPVELSLHVDVRASGFTPCARGDDLCSLFSHHLAANTPKSGWEHVLDGVEDAVGVHYKTRGRMALFRPPFPVDVTDRDDANGIGNSLESEVDYVCREQDILVTWRFRPTHGPVTLQNAYTWIWTAYSKDQDLALGCDQVPGGNEWPGTDGVPFPFFDLPLFVQSNLPLHTGGPPPRLPAEPRQFVRVSLGACPTVRPYSNPVVYTSPFAVGDGSWMRWAEAPSLVPTGRNMRYTQLGVPGSGSGAYDDPVLVRWKEMVYGDESYDGVLGGGVVLNEPWRLETATWHASRFALSNQARLREPVRDCPRRECDP